MSCPSLHALKVIMRLFPLLLTFLWLCDAERPAVAKEGIQIAQSRSLVQPKLRLNAALAFRRTTKQPAETDAEEDQDKDAEKDAEKDVKKGAKKGAQKDASLKQTAEKDAGKDEDNNAEKAAEKNSPFSEGDAVVFTQGKTDIYDEDQKLWGAVVYGKKGRVMPAKEFECQEVEFVIVEFPGLQQPCCFGAEFLSKTAPPPLPMRLEAGDRVKYT